MFEIGVKNNKIGDSESNSTLLSCRETLLTTKELPVEFRYPRSA